MTRADRTTITISSEVAGLIDEALAQGGYTSPNDAIWDALLLHREQKVNDMFGISAGEIDRLIDEAVVSGPGHEIDIEEIKREGFRRAGLSYPGA